MEELDLRETFISEAREALEDIESDLMDFENNPENENVIISMMRTAHTLKGSSAAIGFENLAAFAHKLESLIVKIQKKEITPSSEIMNTLLKSIDILKIFVSSIQNHARDDVNCEKESEELDNFIQSQGLKEEKIPEPKNGFFSFDDETDDHHYENEEKQKSQSDFNIEENSQHTDIPPVDSIQVKQEKSISPRDIEKINTKSPESEKSESIRINLDKIDNLINFFGEQVIIQAFLEDAITDVSANENLITKSVMQLSKITYDLQQTSMSLRMVSLKGIIQKIKRTARDTAQSLGKKINVSVLGEECELDKILVDSLNNVITHLIRNAVDHGVESPEKRLESGKDEQGNLYISAYQEQGSFYLSIKDDGKGLDATQILNKAKSIGLVQNTSNISENEIFNLIFHSGFSTKESVSDISGRGVGMDAVYNAIHDMRGSIQIHSKLGEGTEFVIKLPLSMSIFNGIVFKSQNNRYVIASSEIQEIYKYKDKDISFLNDKERILEKGDKSMPIKNLRDILKNKSSNKLQNSNENVVFVVKNNGKDYALEVDSVLENRRIVQKNLGSEFENRKEFTGGAILSDGHVALILNLNNLLPSS